METQIPEHQFGAPHSEPLKQYPVPERRGNDVLIGITGNADAAKRAAAIHLADALQLRHWNMRQPIIDACAALTGISKFQFSLLKPDTPLPLLKCTVEELEQHYSTVTRRLNNHFLIASLSTLMTTSLGSFLYSGNIVEGITTPTEADWICAHGGILIHINTAGQPVTSRIEPIGPHLVFECTDQPDMVRITNDVRTRLNGRSQ